MPEKKRQICVRSYDQICIYRVSLVFSTFLTFSFLAPEHATDGAAEVQTFATIYSLIHIVDVLLEELIDSRFGCCLFCAGFPRFVVVAIIPLCISRLPVVIIRIAILFFYQSSPFGSSKSDRLIAVAVAQILILFGILDFDVKREHIWTNLELDVFNVKVELISRLPPTLV